MKRGINFKELREIKKKVLEGVKIENSSEKYEKIAGFDIVFIDDTVLCGVVVFDIETLKIIETKILSFEVEMNYYPEFVAFREGIPIVAAFKELENKPDILMIEGGGFTGEKRLGVAAYVGVMLNKPVIGIQKKLIFERLDVDNIISEGKKVGMALKTKEYANPVFVIPGHGIDIETSVEITRKTLVEHKMPEPLHVSHILTVKEKKNLRDSF